MNTRGQSTAKVSYMCVSVSSYMDVSVSSGGPRWQPSSEDPGEDPPGIHGGSSTKSKDPCVSSTAKIGGSTETTCPYIILIKGRHGKLLKSCFLDFYTVGSWVKALLSRLLHRRLLGNGYF